MTTTPPSDSVPPVEPTPPPAAPPIVPPADPYAATQPNAPAPAQPYGAPPAYGYAQPYYAAQAPFNVLAIVGFVLAFVVSLGAVICGHIALSQIKRTGERGHGLALAAVILGYVGIGFGLIWLVIVIAAIAVGGASSVVGGGFAG